MLPSVNN